MTPDDASFEIIAAAEREEISRREAQLNDEIVYSRATFSKDRRNAEAKQPKLYRELDSARENYDRVARRLSPLAGVSVSAE